ncbi:hypothetical protein GU262_15475 [Vibrio cholerae]|uniref:hypothetical protein n=1 Tax=Vibrio paracholerae TaxID=650003 RepID=UPI000D3CF4B1|nr:MULTISPECIES: hypothetical protein [Vibrio]MBN7283505.1 hypothetical protein [Vibrio paracholerae]PUA70013.1 hypothetical protein DB317_17570 [Vibrio cholerae]
MTPTEIESIASAIVAKGINFPWWSYAIFIGIALCSLFIKEYIAMKAKYTATKENFNNLLSQIENETTLKEKIKNSLSYETWLKQEKNSVLRDRIEVLVTNVISVRKVVEQLANTLGLANENRFVMNNEFDEILKIEMIQLLYFPSLEVEVIELKLHVIEFSRLVQQSNISAHKAIETNDLKYIEEMKVANQNVAQKYPEVINAIKCICDKAKIISSSID